MVSFHTSAVRSLMIIQLFAHSRVVTSFSIRHSSINNKFARISPVGTKSSTSFKVQPSQASHYLFTSLSMSSTTVQQEERYSMADQEARYNKAKLENNQRFLDITSVYDPTYLKGKRVAITGANRGLGLAMAKEVTEAGGLLIAIVRTSSPELDALNPIQIITGVDATKTDTITDLHSKIEGGPIDILVNNAGYFKTEVETIDKLDFDDEIKTIDICAIGPLRITSNLINHNILTSGSKVIMITSQGGSVSWRPTQCPNGGDYGHHMSKAAANMMAMLLAQEVKNKNIAVGIFHPGFNKTGMTAKYAEIWEREGAVDPSVGAKRVFHETKLLSMDTTGKFINCEDGLEIPF